MSAGQPEVLGKYTLLRKLAAGGMAEVFLSRVAGPAGFEKTVVVKRILGHLAEDPSFIAMFLAEAKLAAQLNHPNVVQVFDFGEQGGTWFLVMELIDGLNLRHLFRKAAEKGEYLPIGVALKIAIMALEGLAYAHEFADPSTGEPLALVHRDVSPDNILVGRNGAVKVVDFGIAKAANQTHLTRTGTVKGKFSYMPPEQLQGQPLDKRADVFAMGIVLYELLTARKPFDTSNDAVVVRAILYETFVPLRTYRLDAPEALEQILSRALAKDVSQRYADCRAMAVDLEKLLLVRSESATPYEISQLVQRLGGPSTIAIAPTPKPVPSIIAAGAPTLPPFPHGSAPQAATMPMEPTLSPAKTAVEVMPPPPPPQTVAGATTPQPQVKVVEPSLSAFATMPTPGPREAPPLGPLGTIPTPGPREAPPLTTPAPAPAPYVGTPSQPGVAAPGGGAPSFDAIPPAPEWAAPPREPALATTTPGWAQTPLHHPAADASKRTLVVVEEVPEKRSSAVLWVAAAVAAVIGVTGTWAYLSTRERPPVVVKVEPAITPPVVEPEPVKPPPVVVVTPPPVEPVAEVVDAGLVVATVDVPVKPPKTRPKPKPDKVELSPPPPPPAASDELVDFRVRPFGTVTVDGRALGDTPFPPVKLSPGVHRVQVVNRDLNKTVTRTFEVKAGGQNVFRLNLEEEVP
ncbi:MAG: protein kinase [Myxococcales bacterium]|nr:protein kinase [Myxococcales bacterium]